MKPRIKKIKDGVWQCSYGHITAHGMTPKSAYQWWKNRKEFLSIFDAHK